MRTDDFEFGLYSPCQHEHEHAARGEYDANIEEMIADGGFGFHAKEKLKLVFLNQLR